MTKTRFSVARLAVAPVLFLGLAACANPDFNELGTAPDIMPSLATTEQLTALPPPAQPFTVAIYSFRDRTGQRDPNANVAELSTALTQGASAILIDAAYRAGGGEWFSVVERDGLENLLRERQIIRATRQQFGNETPLNPLTFAGILLEGGLISYDTNTLTGGAGARVLGIGANTEYQADTISVYLRASSVNSGEIVESVHVTKTLFSAQLQSNVFKFISAEEILEAEAGITANEPTQIAVRQAIEAAVYALIMEGKRNDLWNFDDPARGDRLSARYEQDVHGQPPR